MFPLASLFHECLFFLGYITGRSEFPKQLPRAREEELVARMAQGDEEARQLLITHNLRLVSHIARKYTVPGYGPDDLISIGVIGLIKAVGSYKAGCGTSLGTYAARCIANEILTSARHGRCSDPPAKKTRSGLHALAPGLLLLQPTCRLPVLTQAADHRTEQCQLLRRGAVQAANDAGCILCLHAADLLGQALPALLRLRKSGDHADRNASAHTLHLLGWSRV